MHGIRTGPVFRSVCSFAAVSTAVAILDACDILIGKSCVYAEILVTHTARAAHDRRTRFFLHLWYAVDFFSPFPVPAFRGKKNTEIGAGGIIDAR